MPIDQRFAFITDESGNHYQAPKYEMDENGELVAVDWDEQATRELIASGSVTE